MAGGKGPVTRGKGQGATEQRARDKASRAAAGGLGARLQGGWLLAVGLSLTCLLGLLACIPGQGSGRGGPATAAVRLTPLPTRAATPALQVDLALTEKDVKLGPLPLRAGFPFTITATIRNRDPGRPHPPVAAPVMVYLSAEREETGYAPFLQVLTVTVPATQSAVVQVPVRWNLSGGLYRLWIQANRLPQAWQDRMPSVPESDLGDNVVLLDLTVQPFDAYTSPLCPGRVDVEIGPQDVLPDPERQRVRVRIHNIGNRAVYNLPVIVVPVSDARPAQPTDEPSPVPSQQDGQAGQEASQLTGLAYTPAIAPCGGTAEVEVEMRPMREGESFQVQVNPEGWAGGLVEDDWENNAVAVAAGLTPGAEVPPGTGLVEYDFTLAPSDVESPEPWIVVVTVHNLGTRDAARVPVRIENAAGRKINDVVPLVQGNGLGVAAFRVGYLWTRGGTLTLTVNPAGGKNGYPEVDRSNNTTTFALP